MEKGQITASVTAWKLKKEFIQSPRIFTDTIICECTLLLKEGPSTEKIMCTEEQLEELVIGHLLCQGRILTKDDVEFVHQEMTSDGVTIEVRILTDVSSRIKENQGNERLPQTFPMDMKKVMEFSEVMLTSNPLFEQTGALHSCLISTNDGEKQYVCSDMGRHNAIDKAIGCMVKAGENLQNCTLFTTGRVPSDMMMKAVVAGIPMMVSRGAVTRQAIELARKHGIILCGFSRGERLNIYTADMGEA